ncbi:MAG: class II fumarate hydratase [Acidobacteria bacterium]|nr:class II fumarate hydratase [Acidobacteriota bacterium]
MSYRIEVDSLGQVLVPEDALWGAQTQRAMENFPISGYRFPREFLRALGIVKAAAAETNIELGILDKTIGGPIIKAAREVMTGKWDNQFVVDIYQTGSGTSTHMNANEVIASLAGRFLREETGHTITIHPNDHVNMGQSTNDVMPTCLHISAYEALKFKLVPVLNELASELEKKSREFDDIVKLGRTHLQDATPIRLGQEFSGYVTMVNHGIQRIENSLHFLGELALGGTAVGTGINTHPGYAGLAVRKINLLTGIEFREAGNHFEAQAGRDAIVQAHAAIKTAAVSLTKIANDIRWMGAGPYGNIAELIIPPVQPGSSIMPGKINPVMAEALLQVTAQVIGNDTVISTAGMSGNFELNNMIPVMAFNFLASVELLANAVREFNRRCVVGLTADKKRCRELVEKSLALAARLTPFIGYDKAAEIAREAYESGKTLKEVMAAKNLIPKNELDSILDPMAMTEP